MALQCVPLSAPAGLQLRVVVDDTHTQMAPLMQYVKQLEADKTRLQARLDRHIQMSWNARNQLHVYECDLHGMTIGDGTAQKMLDQEWATVNQMVANTNRDYNFRVICGAGSHNNGPAPMKKFVKDWFAGKRLLYSSEANEAIFFHVIKNRGN